MSTSTPPLAAPTAGTSLCTGPAANLLPARLPNQGRLHLVETRSARRQARVLPPKVARSKSAVQWDSAAQARLIVAQVQSEIDRRARRLRLASVNALDLRPAPIVIAPPRSRSFVERIKILLHRAVTLRLRGSVSLKEEADGVLRFKTRRVFHLCVTPTAPVRHDGSPKVQLGPLSRHENV